jgi:hypothetical protein
MVVGLAAELQVIVTMPSLRVSLTLSLRYRFASIIHCSKLPVSGFLMLNDLTVYQCGILEFKRFE